MSNAVNKFVVTPAECEQRSERGEGVRSYDLPVPRDVCDAFTTLSESQRIDIRSLFMRVRQEVNVKDRLFCISEVPKLYPEDLEDQLQPQNTDVRKDFVVATLKGLLEDSIKRIGDGASHFYGYGGDIKGLSLNLAESDLRAKGIRIDPQPVGNRENAILRSWIEELVSPHIIIKIKAKFGKEVGHVELRRVTGAILGGRGSVEFSVATIPAAHKV